MIDKNMNKQIYTIAVDFDGTIVKDAFPNYPTEFIPDAKESLIELHNMGHILILWTLRDHGDRYSSALEEAKRFLINEHLDFMFLPNQLGGMLGQKLSADIYIDDRNIGGLVPWKKIMEIIKIKSEVISGSIK